MRRILELRINGWIFLAFVFLYLSVMAIAALFSTLGIIGITYSAVTNVETDSVTGVQSAIYEYYAGEKVYSYSVMLEGNADLLTPQAETVFYFKEYPSVRTSPVEVFIYPALTAAFGLAFALILRYGIDELNEGSSVMREYIQPAVISALSIVPICINISRACRLYTSLLSAMANVKESLSAVSITLMLVNINLLMWGIWVKKKERKTQKDSKQIKA